jgi:autotransporter-associated beta strand protein
MSAFRRRRSTLNPHHLISRACCESLESRRLLAADVWSGAGPDSNYTDNANWVPVPPDTAGVAPAPGQAVDFPVGATSTVVTINANVATSAIEFDAGYTVSSSASSTFTLDGPIDDTAGATIINSPLTLGQTTAITVTSPATLTLNGAVNDGGNAFGITKAGTGTLILDSVSAETYTGTTAVSAGTLVDGADTTLNSDVTVAVGGKFIGDGTIDSLTGSGGTYSAATGTGASAEPGTAIIDDGLELTGAGNTMDFIIGGPGDSSEFVVDGGSINLDGAAFTPTALEYAASAGDVITLIGNNTGMPITGTFAGLAEGATTVIGGNQYTISYLGGASGHDVTLTEIFGASSTTTLSLSKTPIYEGETEILTARVIGADGTLPMGSVEFFDNAAEIGRGTLDGGVAQLADAKLPTGADQIYAIYEGAGVHSSSTSATVIVNVRASTIPIIEGAVTAAVATDTATLNDPAIDGTFGFDDTFSVKGAVANDAANPATTHGVSAGLAVFATDADYANYLPPDNSSFDPDLTYTWTAIHVPSGAKAPTFNQNGDNAASGIGGFDDGEFVDSTTGLATEPLIVHFYKDGGYIFQCQVTDPSQQSAYIDVYATVYQKATSFRIEPHKAQIHQQSAQQYTATVLDQFGRPMRTPQTLSYVVKSGEQSGSISSTGLFFATSVDGAVTIEVEDGLLTDGVSADVV